MTAEQARESGELRRTITRTAAWLLALGTLAAGAVGQDPRPAPPVTAAPPRRPTRFVPRIATSAEDGRTARPMPSSRSTRWRLSPSAPSPAASPPSSAPKSRLTDWSSLLQGGLAASELAASPATKPLWDVEARGGRCCWRLPERRTPTGAYVAGRIGPPVGQGAAPADQSAAADTVARRPDRAAGRDAHVKVGGAALPADIQIASTTTCRMSAPPRLTPGRACSPSRAARRAGGVIAIQWAPGRGGVALTLPVAVMKYAGQIAPSVTVQVTGEPSRARRPRDRRPPTQALTRALDLEDGAQVALSSPPRFTAPLAAGEQTAALFPCACPAPNLLPVTANAAVERGQHAVTPRPPTSCCTPTTRSRSSTARRSSRAVSRRGGRRAWTTTTRTSAAGCSSSTWNVRNDSDRPATVQVIAGLSLPGGDTVQVGRRAGAVLSLKNLNGNFGLVLPVPPHTSVPLITQRFAPGLTVSGLMQLQSLSGGPSDGLRQRRGRHGHAHGPAGPPFPGRHGRQRPGRAVGGGASGRRGAFALRLPAPADHAVRPLRRGQGVDVHLAG